MQAVCTRNLTKTYGDKRVVDGVDLEIGVGRIFGFLGPNGAGKTTTIRMLLGLVRPTEGEVEILGENVRDNRSGVARKVSAIVETPTFFPYMDAVRTLMTYSDYIGVAATKDQCLNLLNRCGLSEAANKRVDAFSLGMKQRLGIAVSLLNDPQVIFLDEPTNGLDPAGIQDVRKLVQQLAGEGKTIFISSHILSEVENICDDICIIDKGRIRASGKLSELLQQPRTLIKARPVQKALIVLNEKFPGAVIGVADDVIDVDANVAVPAVIEKLSAAGIEIHEVSKRSQSLEDFFHQIVNSEN